MATRLQISFGLRHRRQPKSRQAPAAPIIYRELMHYENPTTMRLALWAKRHDISLKKLLALKRHQHDLCAICDKPVNHLHRSAHRIDHDRSGALRGLLCVRCRELVVRIDKAGMKWLDRAWDYLTNPPARDLKS